MSREIKTRALVLRRFPFREKSWILHLHTEAEGTLSVVALGRLSAVTLPGALLQVRLHMRPYREVQRLAEADWDVVYQTLYHDPRRHPYLLLVTEWLSQCLLAPDPSLFAWVREQLIQIDRAPLLADQVHRFLAELLMRWGVPAPATTTLIELEVAYQKVFPEWKPLRSLALLETLTLPTYDE